MCISTALSLAPMLALLPALFQTFPAGGRAGRGTRSVKNLFKNARTPPPLPPCSSQPEIPSSMISSASPCRGQHCIRQCWP